MTPAEPASGPEKLRPSMACNHGDAGKANCDALRAEVCAALKCPPDQLVTAVAYNLNWDLPPAGYVMVTGIPVDMWSAVKSEYHRYLSEEEYDALPEDADTWVTEATCYAQCDRIEDGFALTWRTWKEWFDTRSATESETTD